MYVKLCIIGPHGPLWAHGARGRDMGPGPGTRAPSSDGETLTQNSNIVNINICLQTFDTSKRARDEISCRSVLESRRDLCSETDWWQKGWIHTMKLTPILRWTPLISTWVLTSLVAIPIMDVPVSYWIAIPTQGAGEIYRELYRELYRGFNKGFYMELYRELYSELHYMEISPHLVRE